MTDDAFVDLARDTYPNHVKTGKVTGQIRMYGPAWDFLRGFCYVRDGKKCLNCLVPVDLEKGMWSSMHLAHRKSKGSGGSDVPSNVRTLCISCHATEHTGKEVA